MTKTFDNTKAITYVRFEANETEEYQRYCDSLTDRKIYPYKVVDELIDGDDVILSFKNDVGSLIKVRTPIKETTKVAVNGLNEELEAFESESEQIFDEIVGENEDNESDTTEEELIE